MYSTVFQKYVWEPVPKWKSMFNFSSDFQVVRLKLENGKRIVGTLIPGSALNATLKCLQQGSEEAEETIY